MASKMLSEEVLPFCCRCSDDLILLFAHHKSGSRLPAVVCEGSFNCETVTLLHRVYKTIKKNSNPTFIADVI